MSQERIITSMSRKELAAKYRISTKTLNKYLKHYSLLTDDLKNKSLLPAKTVIEFVKLHGHWEYKMSA